VPLNPEEAKAIVEELVGQGVEAIAVCFLWAFMNPRHEQQVKKLISERHPNIFVCISSELAPVIKEYYRTATVAINAYLGKVTSTYIEGLDKRLKQAGFGRSPMIMQSMGGFATAREASQKPIALLGSGPVGGLIGAKALGEVLGYKNIITSDVGGTTFDVGLIVQGEPQYAIAPVFAKYHTLIPSLEVISIGAGGGSIAWIEPETMKLKVGPQSAGAEPGPVCYDRGGEQPTATDADLILGRIDPDYFLGGRMKLNKAKAMAVMKREIADPLGMDVAQAAMGILEIIDARMADLVRKMSIGRGYDPSDFVLFAFGGAGPTHVGAYGPDAGCRVAVLPQLAAVFSAFGIASADVLRIRELSDPMVVPVNIDRINEIYSSLEAELVAAFREDDSKAEDIDLVRSADVRYRGQMHVVRTPVPPGKLTAEDMEKVIEGFESRYEDKFGKGTALKGAGIQTYNCRVIGTAKPVKPLLLKSSLASQDASGALIGTWDVYFKQYDGFRPTNIYDMLKLQSGNVVSGPAIIQAVDTTVVIHPEQTARMDEYRNLIIQL
jgi:N-methylhydantoinase A